MGTRHRMRHLSRATGRGLRRAARAVGTGLGVLGTRLCYRRQELALLALLAASLLAGFGMDRWKARAPATLESLEAEPPRLAATARAAGARPPSERRASREERSRGGPGAAAPGPRSRRPTLEDPVDLNQATAVDLMGLPGIGPRLAERILARRESLGGRFRSPDDLATVPGLGRSRAGAVAALVTVRGEAHEARETPEPREPPADPAETLP